MTLFLCRLALTQLCTLVVHRVNMVSDWATSTFALSPFGRKCENAKLRRWKCGGAKACDGKARRCECDSSVTVRRRKSDTTCTIAPSLPHSRLLTTLHFCLRLFMCVYPLSFDDNLSCIQLMRQKMNFWEVVAYWNWNVTVFLNHRFDLIINKVNRQESW